MGIRETVNENPAITTGVTAGIILLALIFIVYQACAPTTGGGDAAAPGANKAFFTTDDGKSYFVDDGNHIPPFVVNKAGDPNNGKTAVRAQVFKCGSGQPFVSHLEKYAPEDKKRLEEAMKQAKDKGAQLPMMYMSMGANMMVKKPGTGDRGWTKLSQNTVQQYTQVMQPKCPDGTMNGLQRVTPE